jgi:hypothetical protein
MVIGLLAASLALAACNNGGGATTGGTGGKIEGTPGPRRSAASRSPSAVSPRR